MVRFLRRLVLRLLLLVIVVAGAGVLWLHSSLPVSDGRLVLPGLGAEVRVTRDAHGIPTITAASEHDAEFALGFLHAQDRLFAMDMMRRYGAGRLSEIFGARMISLDSGMRTLGLYRAAERQYPLLLPPVRAALDAYTAGVNAFLTARRGALPPEYYLLHTRPEPWRPADSLVWAKIMDLQLTGNYRRELMRARLLRHLTPEDMAVLFPAYPADGPVTLGDSGMREDDPAFARLMAVLPPRQVASNNWVLDGAHSASGKPLLANDPHLDYSAPGVWYLVRIATPGLNCAGATAPGTPFLIIGHNDHIAWGFTTTGSDVEDVFIERPDPDDPTRYVTPGGALPFVTRREEIRVRDAAAVTLTVRETRHGPVISDLASGAGSQILALQATWLAPDDHSPDAVWAMSRAQDWAGFRKALESWIAPQQNIVYADSAGHIGFIAPARIPIRASGEGWLPSPGWTDEHEWVGTVPFDKLPSTLDPPSGRIVTANNKIVPDDYPYFLTRDWEQPYRAERINALLDATPIQSPSSSADIQLDDVSLAAKGLLPLLLTVAPASGPARMAVDRLKRWDARMDRGKAEPLLFIAWLRELNQVLLSKRLGADFADYWGLHPDVVRLILAEHRDWCDQGDCNAALLSALDLALADLARRYGADMDAWRWGRAHPASFASSFWSNVPVIGDWVDLAIAADGGQDTINAAAMDVRDPAAPFVARHGPGLRMIVDLAQPDAARFMIAPGQSGNPLSPYWGDLLRPWRDGAYLTLNADASGGVLTLAPK